MIIIIIIIIQQLILSNNTSSCSINSNSRTVWCSNNYYSNEYYNLHLLRVYSSNSEGVALDSVFIAVSCLLTSYKSMAEAKLYTSLYIVGNVLCFQYTTLHCTCSL